MTKVKPKAQRKTRGPNKPKEKLTALNPDFFYRKRSALPFFGVGVTQADKMISDGVLPPLVSFGKRSNGWFGRTIAEERKAAANRPRPNSRDPEASALRKFVLLTAQVG